MTVDPFPGVSAADDLADTGRFAVVPVPDEAGLAGQVRLVVERATGRRWFAKAATAEFDAANEVITARLAQALGLPRPQAAFVPGRGDLVLIQHVADHPDDGELLAAGVDIAGEPSLFGPDEAALGRLAQDLADPASLVCELLFAFLVDNDDGAASLGEFGSGVDWWFSLHWSDGIGRADRCAPQVSRTDQPSCEPGSLCC
jgi:hypothetical protein